MINEDELLETMINSVAEIRKELFKIAPQAVKTIKVCAEQTVDKRLAFDAAKWCLETLLDDPQLSSNQSSNLLVLAQALRPPTINAPVPVTKALDVSPTILPKLELLTRTAIDKAQAREKYKEKAKNDKANS